MFCGLYQKIDLLILPNAHVHHPSRFSHLLSQRDSPGRGGKEKKKSKHRDSSRNSGRKHGDEKGC